MLGPDSTKHGDISVWEGPASSMVSMRGDSKGDGNFLLQKSLSCLGPEAFGIFLLDSLYLRFCFVFLEMAKGIPVVLGKVASTAKHG